MFGYLYDGLGLGITCYTILCITAFYEFFCINVWLLRLFSMLEVWIGGLIDTQKFASSASTIYSLATYYIHLSISITSSTPALTVPTTLSDQKASHHFSAVPRTPQPCAREGACAQQLSWN